MIRASLNSVPFRQYVIKYQNSGFMMDLCPLHLNLFLLPFHAGQKHGKIESEAT